MPILQDGISLERKPDGAVVITISASLLRLAEPKIQVVAKAQEALPPPTPPSPPQPASPKPIPVVKPPVAASNLKHYLTVKEVAGMLNICERSVWRLMATGDFPHHRIGKMCRFLADEVEDWMNTQKRRR